MGKSKKKILATTPSHTKVKPQKQLSISTWCSIIIFAFSFLLYANTINHDFTLDDDLVIAKNYLVQQGFEGIPLLFTKAYRYGFNNVNSGIYRPLTPILFAIEYQFFGLNPHVNHFFNVLYYALSGLLLFKALQYLLSIFLQKKETLITGLPFIITMLYVGHPLHTEVVASAKSRDEIMGFLFLLISTIYLLRSSIKPSNKINMIISLCAFYLALISKESSILYIGVIILICLFILRESIKKTIQTIIPYLAISGIYLISFYFFINKMVGTHGVAIINNSLMATDDVLSRFATKMVIMGKYILLLIFPHPLRFDYSYNQIPNVSLTDPFAIISFLVVFGILGFSIKQLIDLFKQKTDSETNALHQLIGFSILFYSIMIFLVSNLLIHIEATMAERFLYVPSLGFAIISGLLLCKILKLDLDFSASQIRVHKAASLSLTVILALYSYQTISRNPSWKNNFTLYSSDIVHLENSARANFAYGSEILSQADRSNNKEEKGKLLQTAKAHLVKAVEIHPKYHSAYINLSNACNKLKQFGESIKYMTQMVSADTGYVDGFYQLGLTYNIINDYPNAIKNFNRVLKLRTKYFKAHNALGIIYVNQKMYDKALEHYQASLNLNPSNSATINNIKGLFLDKGVDHGKNGDFASAIAMFTKGLEFKPNDPDILSNMGIAYAQSGDPNNALKSFETALKYKPSDKGILRNIGIMYQQLGDTLKANAYFRKAN